MNRRPLIDRCEKWADQYASFGLNKGFHNWKFWRPVMSMNSASRRLVNDLSLENKTLLKSLLIVNRTEKVLSYWNLRKTYKWGETRFIFFRSSWDAISILERSNIEETWWQDRLMWTLEEGILFFIRREVSHKDQDIPLGIWNRQNASFLKTGPSLFILS